MDIRFQIRLRLRHLEDVIRALRIMEICPCSPDVGDCSKCRNPDGTSKQVVRKHALKTRRRAQFLKNIKTSRRKTSRRK
jgi:hypothetical protein